MIIIIIIYIYCAFVLYAVTVYTRVCVFVNTGLFLERIFNRNYLRFHVL